MGENFFLLLQVEMHGIYNISNDVTYIDLVVGRQ